MFAAVVEVLASWARGAQQWSSRPVGVVTVASRHRPALVRSMGERIATVGRLPLLGEVSSEDTGEASRTNSAQRVRALADAYHLGPELLERLAAVDGPVLLVDDLVDTGWTMALVARLLRRAGAPAVLPFALAMSA